MTCFAIDFSAQQRGVPYAREVGGLPQPTGPTGFRETTVQELTGIEVAEAVELLRCKLAWFGFQSIEIGRFVHIKDGTVLVDLLDQGEVLCRLELEGRLGSIKSPSRRGLRRLMTSMESENSYQ